MLSLSIVDKYHLQLDVELDTQIKSAQWKMYLFFPAFMANDSDTYAPGQFKPKLLQQQTLSTHRNQDNSICDITNLTKLTTQKDAQHLPLFFTALADCVNNLLEQLKQLKKAQKQPFGDSQSLMGQFQSVANKIESLHKLLACLPKGKKHRYLKLATQLLSYHLFQALLAHKKRNKAPWLNIEIEKQLARAEKYKYRLSHDTEGGRERLLDKYEVSRRILNTPYLLKRKKLRGSKVAEQMIFAFAAALAMAFATAVAFATQQSFGNFSTPFFFSLVISYIFKDRIKELGRNYLLDKYFKFFFQSHYRLYSKYSSKAVMDIRESFFRISSHQLDDNVKKHRLYFAELDTNSIDGISVFHRHYRPQTNKDQSTPRKFKDKLTINLSKRLRAAPGITRNHYRVVADKVCSESVYRVQPIYVVIEQSHQQEQSVQLFRLITSRRGIHRLEVIEQSNHTNT